VAQKFHFAILRIELTRASRGLSAIAELLVETDKARYLTYVTHTCIECAKYYPGIQEMIIISERVWFGRTIPL